MPFEFHRVVKNTPDTDQAGSCNPVKQQVPRMTDDAALVTRPIAAMAKVIASDILAQLRPEHACRPFRIGRNITQ